MVQIRMSPARLWISGIIQGRLQLCPLCRGKKWKNILLSLCSFSFWERWRESQGAPARIPSASPQHDPAPSKLWGFGDLTPRSSCPLLLLTHSPFPVSRAWDSTGKIPKGVKVMKIRQWQSVTFTKWESREIFLFQIFLLAVHLSEPTSLL